jgi:hypothetical protein
VQVAPITITTSRLTLTALVIAMADMFGELNIHEFTDGWPATRDEIRRNGSPSSARSTMRGGQAALSAGPPTPSTRQRRGESAGPESRRLCLVVQCPVGQSAAVARTGQLSRRLVMTVD